MRNVVRPVELALVLFWCCALAANGCSAHGAEDPELHPPKDSGHDTKGRDTWADDTGDPPPDTPDTSEDDALDTSVDGTEPLDTSVVDTGGRDTAGCTGGESEPNDTESTAIALAGIDDCDGSGASIKGVIESGTDVDFFRYEGTDTFGCVVDATMLGATSLELCVYVKCKSGTTTTWKDCPKGTKTTSPGGNVGCCGSGGAQIDYTCPATGTSDSATVWMSVEAPGTLACIPYNVTYHF